jgi:hypothetical protein
MASAAEVQPGLYNATDEKGDIERRGSVARTEKGRWERLWPVIACGAGLFSDGYLNNVRRNRPKKRQQDIFQRDNIDPHPKATPLYMSKDLNCENRNADRGIVDHWTSQHDVEDYLPRFVCELLCSSKRRKYNFCWHSRGDVVLRVHI